MSALPPKADIAERDHHFRFVPKGDIARRLLDAHFNLRGGIELLERGDFWGCHRLDLGRDLLHGSQTPPGHRCAVLDTIDRR